MPDDPTPTKSWIQRSIISGILIMAGESAVTLVEVWHTDQFPIVAAAKFGSILVFVGEILRRQTKDPVVPAPPEDQPKP